MAPRSMITDLSHFLEDGQVAEALTNPGRALVAHAGAIVAWMSSGKSEDLEQTNVACRRSPGRVRCMGEMVAEFELANTRIAWRCPKCGANGVISGWQDSPWDRGYGERPLSEDVLRRCLDILGPELSAKPLVMIDYDEPVPVQLSARQKELIEDLVIDESYAERLRASKKGFVGDFTLGEIEDIHGYAAAEANHCENAKRKREYDALFSHLEAIERNYQERE